MASDRYIVDATESMPRAENEIGETNLRVDSNRDDIEGTRITNCPDSKNLAIRSQCWLHVLNLVDTQTTVGVTLTTRFNRKQGENPGAP